MIAMVDHIKSIKPKRYALPLLSSGGLLFFKKFQNYIYTPPIVFFVSFILFLNFPIIVTYTNLKPLYFEDLFIDMSQLPTINIQKNAKNSFENYYLWILITTNALLVSALSNYWLFKTRDTHSYYEVIGVTGGILKIFQVINHYSGTLILKYIQKTIDKKQNVPEIFQYETNNINVLVQSSLQDSVNSYKNTIIDVEL